MELTMDELQELFEKSKLEKIKRSTEWPIGRNVFIRTVTMYYVGELQYVSPTDFALKMASWVADTGKFSQAIEKGSLSEVEIYPPDKLVRVNRGAYVDLVEIDWPLPTVSK